MDLAKVLAQLHEELENLDAAILSLKRLQRAHPRGGRPPKVLAEINRKIHGSLREGAGAGSATEEPGGH